MEWTSLDLLLTGGQHELMPATLAEHIALAKRWVAHPSLTPEERSRIQAVWLDNQYQPRFPLTHKRWQQLRLVAGEIK